MPRHLRPARATRPTRTSGYGTTQARGATFAGLTHGTGLTPIVQKAPGPLGPQFAHRFGQYSPICQGWIALTLRDPHAGPRVNFHNVGTGPELVVYGFFLSRGAIPERDLYFQEEKVIIDDRTRTSRKVFIVDVSIDSPWGGTIYLNIDGVWFHTRTELEEFKDAIRDRDEGRKGRPVDVPDTQTFDPATLEAFFQREGVIA